MNISIVDDNKDFVEAMQVVLSMVDGINIVYTASNGRDFLLHPGFHDLDLVFTDIRMPVMDGIETMKAAKQMKPELIIVAVSNIDKKLGLEQSSMVGASAFIEKDNISRRLLLEVIERFTNNNNNQSK